MGARLEGQAHAQQHSHPECCSVPGLLSVLGGECSGRPVLACNGVQSICVSPGSKPSEPAISLFWTNPDCQDIPPYAMVHDVDDRVSGLISQTPGHLWQYVIGHLTKIQSVINRGYFDDIQYVEVPASWCKFMNASQLQHGLASVSEKEISQDGWARCTDPAIILPEGLKLTSKRGPGINSLSLLHLFFPSNGLSRAWASC